MKLATPLDSRKFLVREEGEGEASDCLFKSSEVRPRNAASLRNIFGWSMLVSLKIPYMEVPNGKFK